MRGLLGSGRGLFIGEYFGIEFYLHYSWFPIAALLAYGLGTDMIPELLPGRSMALYLVLSLVAAALFFLSLLLHELGHSLVSQRCGIAVPRITLLFIGGLAEIAREPDDAKSELKIALGGPAVSVALVALYAGCSWLFAWLTWDAPALVCEWLAVANLTLVIFNMFPGYPLDGGRVLRALLWMKSGRLRRATYISSRIGIGFAWLLSGLGVWLVIVPPPRWNGFIFIIIGMFLRKAAESGYQNAAQRELFAGLSVGDLMTRSPIAIPEHLPINRAVDEYFLASHHSAYPVCAAEGELRGLLRLNMLLKLPRERWPYITAGDAVAESGGDDAIIHSSAPAAEAMRLLLGSGSDRLAVTGEGRLIGILTRADLHRSIEIRTALES